MNETKNVSRRTRNPIFFRKDGGWKSVSTDCIVCMEACAYKCIFYIVSQGQVIDIMTFNPKSQTYIKNHIFWWLKDGYVEIIL